MIWIVRILVGLVGLFSLGMGLGAWVAPEALGQILGIGALDPKGVNSLRADIGAFFLAAGAVCIGALVTGRAGWLYLGALLYALAAAGRILGVLVAGLPEGVASSILLELVVASVLVLGARRLQGAGPA